MDEKTWDEALWFSATHLQNVPPMQQYNKSKDEVQSGYIIHLSRGAYCHILSVARLDTTCHCPF
jgi:hypothetical protein